MATYFKCLVSSWGMDILLNSNLSGVISNADHINNFKGLSEIVYPNENNSSFTKLALFLEACRIPYITIGQYGNEKEALTVSFADDGSPARCDILPIESIDKEEMLVNVSVSKWTDFTVALRKHDPSREFDCTPYKADKTIQRLIEEGRLLTLIEGAGIRKLSRIKAIIDIAANFVEHPGNIQGYLQGSSAKSNWSTQLLSHPELNHKNIKELSISLWPNSTEYSFFGNFIKDSVADGAGYAYQSGVLTELNSKSILPEDICELEQLGVIVRNNNIFNSRKDVAKKYLAKISNSLQEKMANKLSLKASSLDGEISKKSAPTKSPKILGL